MNSPRNPVRRVPRMPREGSNRTKLRSALAHGDWDDLPTTMPARTMRRPALV